MKRIILGISVLLILAQNGFAETDAEFDKKIENESDKVWKQIYQCNKESSNHQRTGDVNICLKAIKLINKNPYVFKEGMQKYGEYNNAGILYKYSDKNYLKAYEYYMKAAKLGNINAQKNLNIMCKENPWACK
jgi:hypothetical protein